MSENNDSKPERNEVSSDNGQPKTDSSRIPKRGSDAITPTPDASPEHYATLEVPTDGGPFLNHETSPLELDLEDDGKVIHIDGGSTGATSLTSLADQPTTIDPNAPISKNQLKKRRRLEKLKLVCQRRKEQDRQARIAKALAQGRDLEEERRVAAERTATGEGKKRRQEAWEQQKLPLVKQSFRICLDCSFESVLTPKEVASLALQIRHCYSANRRSPHPSPFAVTSLTGETLAVMNTVVGFDEWNLRAFDHSPLSLEQYYGADELENIIYLTSDADDELLELNDKHVYVIGGIVDRNRLKGATLERARALGVKTAKLPLGDYLNKSAVKRVLTCNHVLQILLEYRTHGRDWGKAFASVLPRRKLADVTTSPTPSTPKADEREGSDDDSASSNPSSSKEGKDVD